MTDLSGSILGNDPTDIARYFNCQPCKVSEAMALGANTYEDVYRHIKGKEIHSFPAIAPKIKYNSKGLPQKGNSKWGRNFFSRSKL